MFSLFSLHNSQSQSLHFCTYLTDLAIITFKSQALYFVFVENSLCFFEEISDFSLLSAFTLDAGMAFVALGCTFQAELHRDPATLAGIKRCSPLSDGSISNLKDKPKPRFAKKCSNQRC